MTPRRLTPLLASPACRPSRARHPRSLLGVAALFSAAALPASAAGPVAASAPTASAATLQCGEFSFPYCKGPATQYGADFRPGTGFGGFGGQAGCRPRRPPVIFVHGNADSAIGWAAAVSRVGDLPAPPHSVYDRFIAQGYQPCELYGVSYLTKEEQAHPKDNFHRIEKYRVLLKFIAAVQRHTGAAQVDIVAHSLGVSMTMAALSYQDELGTPRGKGWSGVRRFINIAGGLRGLGACRLMGPGNFVVPTCGSQQIGNPWVFGFYPDNGIPLAGANRWTAANGAYALRDMPQHHPKVDFYTLHAGLHDQVHCGSTASADCAQGALFEAAPNVRAQLDVGTGASARQTDFDFKDHSAFVSAGGDADGVGHFKARNQSGEILVQMLQSACRGKDCQGSYRSGPVRAEP
jgi:pimeloyl-ACP methyl ester carboxylesterase